jgi:hypothetical protein
MKKISIISTIALMILASSCRKDLDQVPLSAATTSTFYAQPADFLQGVNAAYSSLRNYPDRQCYLSEIRSDNLYAVTLTGRDWDPINDFAAGIAPNTYVEEAWSANFVGIFRANTVLDQISKNPAAVGSAALATRLQAESRFLRAFYYFDLVRYFGKVPIIDHPVNAEDANTIGRSPVTDVYAMIIKDLQFAIANLPATFTGTFPNYTANDVGRATKYSAEAILAEVYMARSSATYNIEGPGLGLNEWSLALPLLQDIINSGQFTFNTNYANIFAYANSSPAVNKEAVFDVMYLGGQTPVVGADFVWQLVTSTYFSSLAITGSNGALGDIPVSTNMMNSYETGDVRKTQSVFTAGFTYQGSFDGQPFFKKYLDVTKAPTTSRFDWNINFMAVRYTDVLMMKAECILHGAPGAQTDVDAIVNQVRTRAGLPAKTGVTLAQLFDERRHEFANEGTRWFDLQRSGNLVTIMNAWKAADDNQNKINTVTANSVIYPVPQSQMDTKPGLYTQNPGY